MGRKVHITTACALILAFLGLLASPGASAADAKIGAQPSPLAEANDWPWWGGPESNNHAVADQKPPLKWSESENVIWKTKLQGQGHGTPCVQGDRIYLASADKKQEAIWILCLDRASGKEVWKTPVYNGPMAKIHGHNSYASSTVASDGESLYLPYQTKTEVRMVVLDLEGKKRWDKSLSSYDSIQGFSASPVLYRAAIIVPIDGKENNFLVALDRRTGEVIWKANVPDKNDNAEVPEHHESYASTSVLKVAGRYQAIQVGPDHVRSFDADTGKFLWVSEGPAMCYVAGAVTDGKTVFATGGWPKKALMAIRADGSGNVTKTHLTWKTDDKKAAYVPSLLLDRGILYTQHDAGQFRCYDAATGKMLWEERLKGNFYSSPVLVGDKIFVFNRTGDGYVLKTGRKFELLAQNKMPDGAFATPVIIQGRVYLRTLKALYCLGDGK